jgi:UDP:flavonoid glycosyltransferase YjiC (YdhE family)
VTWQAGGGAQVALALSRQLAERNHRVRVLAPAELCDRVVAAGCVACSYPAEVEFDRAEGRRMEDQRPLLDRLFFGQQLPGALLEELKSRPADVVVVDYLLRSTVASTELQLAPTALLIHTVYGFHGVSSDDEARRRAFDPVNLARWELGLPPLPVGSESVTVTLARRAVAVLVALPREFDNWPEPPSGVVHVGWMTEAAGDLAWRAPWPEADERPLVVVSLGTTYMQQEAVVGRVAEAVSRHEVRVLVLTGQELEPSEVDVPDGVVVEQFVPHEVILPEAALVVAHGGTGTLLAALGAGVPVLSLPLGRDQPANARRLEQLGLGCALDREASVAEIDAAVTAMLGSEALHARVREFASALGAYDVNRAASTLEGLAG